MKHRLTWIRKSVNEARAEGWFGNQHLFNVSPRRNNCSKWVLDMLDEESRAYPHSLRFRYVDEFPSMAAAKIEAERLMENRADATKQRRLPVHITENNKEFFPTPMALAGKMFSFLKGNGLGEVLEPSAGDGALVEAIVSYEYRTNCRPNDEINVDCIEKDEILRAALRGKGYRVVGDDFLSFCTQKRYNTIIMNPPFSNGDEHLLKALDLLSAGGQVVCLLNAETIRNPYTNRRKLLLQKIREYDGRVCFISDAFKHARRATNVDVAIVYMKIPTPAKQSVIFQTLHKAQDIAEQRAVSEGLIPAPKNWMQQMVSEFELDAKAGIHFVDEYLALNDELVRNDNSGATDFHFFELHICGDSARYMHNAQNRFLQCLREHYWRKLLTHEELTSRMTSAMREDYEEKLTSLREYDFSEYNIRAVFEDISSQLTSGVEESIRALFQKFTEEHCWYPEMEKNIHYYNGWKTNKAHKIGKKVIIPINGAFASSWSREYLDTYTITSTIRDMERALNFLDRGETICRDSHFVGLERANELHQSRNVHFTYFDVTFYKKGTAHITFHDDAQRIIDRLNIFVGKDKAWLPPCYGKKHYTDMTEEEQSVIDEFQGREAYEVVMKNPELYLPSSSNLACLPASMIV